MAGRWRIVRRTRYTRPLTRSVSYRYSSHGIMEQSPVSLGRSRGLANLKTSETSSWTAEVDDDGKPFLSSCGCRKKGRQKLVSRSGGRGKLKIIIWFLLNTWSIGGIPLPKRDFFLRKSCSLKSLLGLWLVSVCFRFLPSLHLLLVRRKAVLCNCFDALSLFIANSPIEGFGFKHRGSAMAMHNMLSNWINSSGPHPCSWQICWASAKIV